MVHENDVTFKNSSFLRIVKFVQQKYDFNGKKQKEDTFHINISIKTKL